jgi:hypothetical protein
LFTVHRLVIKSKQVLATESKQALATRPVHGWPSPNGLCEPWKI